MERTEDQEVESDAAARSGQAAIGVVVEKIVERSALALIGAVL